MQTSTSLLIPQAQVNPGVEEEQPTSEQPSRLEPSRPLPRSPCLSDYWTEQHTSELVC